MQTLDLKLRLPPAQREWLAYRARTDNRTLNATLLRLMTDAMASDPLKVFVHEVSVFDAPTVYTVSIGEFGDDLYESSDRSAALAFARAKLGELGLPKSALARNVVTDHASVTQ